MDIKFFCPRWGSEQLSWDNFCHKVKVAGFDGVEAGVPFDDEERDQMKTALDQHQLQLIGQYWQSFERNFDDHKTSYQSHLDQIASLHPLKIDAQTGKDYFSFDQNKELIEIAFSFTAKTGIPVAHETHRNKALFAAHVARKFFERIPDLRITADLSHWCNVAESFLEDQPEVLAKVPEHTIHIHARVGHTQSAQVTDPRLPEWAVALSHHLHWWKEIIYYHQRAGTASFTITPEFGPAPYMPLAPVTQEPLADQWEINEWMMNYLRKEFLR
jgi:sugar phosphate isomerase/epimerase